MGEEPFQIYAPSVMMRLAPDETAEASNQLLCGETVQVLDRLGEWANVRALHDGYKGFIPMSALGPSHETSHKINAPLTHIYEAADFKAPVRSPLYFGSYLAATDKTQNGFRQLAHGGWVFENHLTLRDRAQSDFVETALMFKDAPYLWGGRTACGIDCSGLVQVSLMAARIECPRDTKDQIKNLGQNIDTENLQRGDFAYFERHVGIMLDDENILNATSRHMRVVVEKLEDLTGVYDGVLGVRRV